MSTNQHTVTPSSTGVDTVPESGPVLVSLDEGEVSQLALDTASEIAGGGAELVVLDAVCPPDQVPLSLGESALDEHREAVLRAVESVEGETGGPVSGTVSVGRDPVSIVGQAVERYDVGIVVVDEPWLDTRFAPVTRAPFEKLAAAVDCPVVAPAGRRPETVSSVLVPVAGGPHSGTSVDVARSLASAHDAWIELLHVVAPGDPEQRRAGEQHLSTAAARLDRDDAVSRWLLEAESAPETIVEQSRYYDVTVIGAPRTPRLARFVSGSNARTIQREGSTVVTVRR